MLTLQVQHMKPHPKPAPRYRNFFRAWRLYKNMSQDAAEEATGIDRTQISKYETGKLRYNQDVLEAFAYAYGCEPADLLVRDPTDPEGMWSIWDQAKPGERRIIVNVAKSILRTGTDD